MRHTHTLPSHPAVPSRMRGQEIVVDLHCDGTVIGLHFYAYILGGPWEWTDQERHFITALGTAIAAELRDADR